MAGIVELVFAIIGPVIELGQFIGEPIKRQFSYLCCFSGNVQNLRDEAKKLGDARERLEMRVNAAKDNVQVIAPEVKTWLQDVDVIQANKTEIETEATDIQSRGCVSVKSRYSLSRKAKKTSEAMQRLREDCLSFNDISLPAQSASTAPIPLGRTLEFQSRKYIEEQIMETLKTNEGNMIFGIWGMGGVGKTTMAKRVMSWAREEHLFDDILMAVVSQPVDMLRIQGELAEKLGLKFEDEESLSSRAHKLHGRLTGEKRILMVLDDVWEHLKLEELMGIPPESDLRGCRILLTSRNRGVLKRMGAKPVCGIPTLSKDEAWSLFKEKAGTCVDDPNVHSIAEKVVEECKCLPIALVTVGAALQDREDPSFWKGVLQKLQRSNPTGLSSLLEEVYKPLRLSYDYLDSGRAQSIFLLCCLFPEDYNIPLEDLTAYAMGLRMFEEIEILEEARNEICLVVGMLKDRFLLLDGHDQYYVRMHDVVRDVAIFIASEERRIKCSDSTWISSSHLGERTKLHMGSDVPNLRLLLIIDKPRFLMDKPADHEELQINDNFFEGTTKLNVLSMIYYSPSSLPGTTQLLKNLRTLILVSPVSLKTISVVSELVSLEIFICRYCGFITELPLEIQRLDRLKLFEISYCWGLKTIAPGVISSLTGLEELKMVGSFNKWEAEDNGGKERKNAALNEPFSLSNLTSLVIEIDSALAVEQIPLPRKMLKYDITIGRPSYLPPPSSNSYKPPSSNRYERKLRLHLPIREMTLGKWIHQCVRSVEYVWLEGEGSYNLDLGQAQNMKSLTFRCCSTAKKLVNITSSPIDDGRYGGTTSNVFPLLEYLKLENLPNLEEIYDIDAFKNLKELIMVDLPALKPLSWKKGKVAFGRLEVLVMERCGNISSLFSSLIAQSLDNLKELTIERCENMVKVIEDEEAEEKCSHACSHEITCLFRGLKQLVIRELPKLGNFCGWRSCAIELPSLEYVEILDCPQMENFSLGSLTTPNLKTIKMAFKDITINTDQDLNGALQQHLCIAKEEESFYKLVAKVQGIKRMSQLQSSIPNLMLQTKDYSVAGEQISFPSDIEKYDISIATPSSDRYKPPSSNTYERKLRLHLPIREMTLGKWIHQCVRSVEHLWLEGEGSYNLELGQAQSMRALTFGGCSMVKKLMDITSSSIDDGRYDGTTRTFLPRLEYLKLENLPNLEEIRDIDAFENLKELILVDLPALKPLFWKPGKIAFSGLEVLVMEHCGNISSLFSSSIAQSFDNLKELTIERWEKMVKVIEDDEDQEKCSHASSRETTCLFRGLKQLEIRELPKLENFCGWRSCAIELPSLEYVEILDCPQIERFSLGSLTTPNLKTIRMAFRDITINPYQDLDGALQQHLSRAKEEESFYKWVAKVQGIKRLSELQCSIPNLMLQTEDCSLAAEQTSLPSNIVKYDITIGDPRGFEFGDFPGSSFPFMMFEKKLRLHLPREIVLGKWIRQCVRSVEYVLLEGEGSNNLDLGQAQNMRSLTFRGCSTVKKLVNMTTSIPAKDCILQLEVLEIVDCKMMEQVFLWKEEENENGIGREIRHTTIFPKLKQLRLSRLPSLTTFCQGIESIEFPLLTEMRIKDCPKLKSPVLSITSSSSTNTRNNSGGISHDEHEYGDDDSLHLFCTPEQLEVLEIADFEMMEHVFLWREEDNESRHVTIFQKLKQLTLSRLPRLTTICEGFESIEFPLLTEMQIRDCPNLRSHVISTTSSSTDKHNSSGAINNGHDDHHDDSLHLFCTPEKVAFDSLKKLVIGEYNNLSILWCDKITNDFFTRLEELWLYHCGSITSLFSSSVARNLVNLKQLRIDDCREMVEVIEDDKERDACEISTVHLFPNLTELYLCDLPKLKRFCKWRCALELRSLEKVEIKGYLKMEGFNFGSALTTPNLKTIKISDWPKVERLSLGSPTTPNLKEIEINNVDIINTNGFIDVLQIQTLRIKSCQVMEQVVSLLNEKENENDMGQSSRGCHIAFPGMEKLELCDLPNVTSFSEGIKSIEFPMLSTMIIDNCPSLNRLVSTNCSSSGCINHGDNDDDSLHLFCEPKVAFGRLKGLEINKYGSNALTLWCHKIPNGFFNGLEWLYISNCGNIRNLFSSSIVGNFVNLQELSIDNCGEMVTVIDNDKENDACGGQSTIYLFPKLTHLWLSSLSKLENFCEWRSCALVLPSLQYVDSSDCSKIERFSLGSALVTPNLETIYMDNENVTNSRDLNAVLQQRFFRVTEEKEKKKKKTEEEEREEKEEDREEDQKRRGEIEEQT